LKHFNVGGVMSLDAVEVGRKPRTGLKHDELPRIAQNSDGRSREKTQDGIETLPTGVPRPTPPTGRSREKTQDGIETIASRSATLDIAARRGREKTQDGIETDALDVDGELESVEAGRKPRTGLKLSVSPAASMNLIRSRQGENPGRD